MNCYQQSIIKRLIKRNMKKYWCVECVDSAESKDKLLPLEFYKDGKFVYIENEKQVYEVESKEKLTLVANN